MSAKTVLHLLDEKWLLLPYSGSSLPKREISFFGQKWTIGFDTEKLTVSNFNWLLMGVPDTDFVSEFAVFWLGRVNEDCIWASV